MKVLILASFNKGFFVPFIVEQAEALRQAGIECDFFGVKGKGITGYLRNLPKLKNKIREFHPDLIHAHYGLSSLLANLQRSIPVVTTFHGSDINEKNILRISRISMFLSSWNIFVSQRNINIAKPHKHFSLIPCGINLPKAQSELPNITHLLEPNKKHILFAGAFNNTVKNSPLAIEAINILNSNSTPSQLIELKGYSRDQVNALMYACDAFLMTSHTEGSPQVVKEAMACGCPIVSVDVGDVTERLKAKNILLEGCYISNNYNAEELSNLLEKAIRFNKRTSGREKIIRDGLTNDIIAQKLIEIYNKVLKK